MPSSAAFGLRTVLWAEIRFFPFLERNVAVLRKRGLDVPDVRSYFLIERRMSNITLLQLVWQQPDDAIDSLHARLHTPWPKFCWRDSRHTTRGYIVKRDKVAR
jgi:hypothetical protein